MIWPTGKWVRSEYSAMWKEKQEGLMFSVYPGSLPVRQACVTALDLCRHGSRLARCSRNLVGLILNSDQLFTHLIIIRHESNKLYISYTNSVQQRSPHLPFQNTKYIYIFFYGSCTPKSNNMYLCKNLRLACSISLQWIKDLALAMLTMPSQSHITVRALK